MVTFFYAGLFTNSRLYLNAIAWLENTDPITCEELNNFFPRYTLPNIY